MWPQDLERILVSERIDTYDPVREWLDGLPEWDGRDRLGELADRVITIESDGNPETAEDGPRESCKHHNIRHLPTQERLQKG